MDPDSHRNLVAAHRGTIASVIDAGRAVAAAWPDDVATESRAVTASLAALLEERGLLPALLELLDDAADRQGEQIRGRPVPAPPYLTVTSRGPVCRGTLAEGRLVVTLAVFEVRRRPTRYAFADPDPGECLRIELVDSPS